MHIIRSEIARPHGRTAAARAELHANGNKITEHSVVHLSFAEGMFDAATASENASKINIGTSRIDFDSGTPSGSQDASPIRVGAGEHCFYQRRSGNSAGHLSCGIVVCRA